MFTTAKNSNRPPLTRKSCTGFPLFPPPPRVVGPGILGVRLGGRCPRKISWVANPSLRNKPTPGERETSLITARIRYRVSSPLPPLRYSARFSNRPRFIKNCTVHAFFSMSWFRFRNRVERECLKNAGSPLAKEGEKEGGLYCNPWKDRVNLVEIRFLFFPFCPFRLLFGSSNIFELFIQFWYRINCGSDILR